MVIGGPLFNVVSIAVVPSATPLEEANVALFDTIAVAHLPRPVG